MDFINPTDYMDKSYEEGLAKKNIGKDDYKRNMRVRIVLTDGTSLMFYVRLKDLCDGNKYCDDNIHPKDDLHLQSAMEPMVQSIAKFFRSIGLGISYYRIEDITEGSDAEHNISRRDI